MLLLDACRLCHWVSLEHAQFRCSVLSVAQRAKQAYCQYVDAARQSHAQMQPASGRNIWAEDALYQVQSGSAQCGQRGQIRVLVHSGDDGGALPEQW